MPRLQRTTPLGAINETGTSKPYVNAMWYKNPQFSDLTITYGANGENKFTGHRLILCSASEWFMNASKNFREANEREIIIKDDCVDGIGALFEFAYTNTYPETNVGCCRYQLLQNRFEQHLRAFATADKYQADAIKEHALALR
jgi:hypothetical protein